MTYSTSDVLIGKWIDGRNIYQRTITGSVTLNGITSINLNSADLQGLEPIDISGYFRRNSDGFQANVNAINGGANPLQYIWCFYIPASGISLRVNLSNDAYTYALTVKHVK